MEKFIILIFARLNSRRLPNKILKKIYFNKTLLDIIYLRLKKNFKYKIIINTSSNKSDDKLVKFCRKRKYLYFRGSLNNVFKRTSQCLLKYKSQYFIRINADRPFVDTNEIKKMILKINLNKKLDIITNNGNKIKCPVGLTNEIARSSLFTSFTKKLKKKEKEHIFNYFYNNKKNFIIYYLKNKLYVKYFKLNLSIDTFKDLKHTRKIFLFYRNIYISTKKVILGLKNEI